MPILLEEKKVVSNPIKSRSRDLSTTFIDNLSLPVHNWFRYSAGFSASWCRELISKEKLNGRFRVLDPFVGSGTVLIESEFCGVESMGIEAHPFIARVARTKLMWGVDTEEFNDFARQVLVKAKNYEAFGDLSEYPPIINKCYPSEVLRKLDSLKKAWLELKDNSDKSELTWLALASILRICSPAGTAQWQYILPNKVKKNTKDPYVAFLQKVELMKKDMEIIQSLNIIQRGVVVQEDARECSSIPNKWADLVVTSPPYANNYDYADATRLEMSFFGEIEGWGDLQNLVRKFLIRSCTQHVAKEAANFEQVLAAESLAPIRKELTEVCFKLSKERENHGGKKNYHAMIAGYFFDLAAVWNSLRRVTSDNSLACFVIGDSAPYGVYAPVDRWLGELALASGFKSFNFEKTRDRNVKWKNRKHTVPLHEGRLWVEG